MKRKKKLAFLGAGSFSDGVFPWVDVEQYEFVGYFDDKDITTYKGFPVFGKIEDVLGYLERKEIDSVFVTIGDNLKRAEIFDKISEKYYECLINIISNKSNIFQEKSIQGKGIFLGFNSFIGSDSYIYDNCIINTGAIVEHHTIIQKHCNITPGVVINGLCNIGEGCYLGSGSIISNLVNLAPYIVLGAGTVVTKSLEETGTYVGVPAVKIK